jgi:hypothetical protein
MIATSLARKMQDFLSWIIRNKEDSDKPSVFISFEDPIYHAMPENFSWLDNQLTSMQIGGVPSINNGVIHTQVEIIKLKDRIGNRKNNIFDLRNADIYGQKHIELLVDGKGGMDRVIIDEKRFAAFFSGRDILSPPPPKPSQPMWLWGAAGKSLIELKNVEILELDDNNSRTPNWMFNADTKSEGNIVGTDKADRLGVLQSGAQITGRKGQDEFGLFNFAYMEPDYVTQVFTDIWATMRYVEIMDFVSGEDKLVVSKDLKPIVSGWVDRDVFQLDPLNRPETGMRGYINLHIGEDWNIGVYTNAKTLKMSDFQFV